MKRIVAFLVTLSILMCMVPAVSAAGSAVNTAAENAANRLHTLGLMNGVGTNADGSPNFDLNGNLTREQAVTMLLRLLGKEEEALAANADMPFTDVSAWAADYVAYAYAHGLTNGTGPTTFHGKREISAAEYVTLVLRALGYSSATDFVWSSPWALSNAIGLTKGEYSSATTRFLRGDMAIVSANALDVTLKDGSKTLLEQIGLTEKPTKEEYIGRIMTDAKLAALKTADLDTLQKEISTIGDAVKFLDQFTPHAYSGFDGEIRLDLDFVYPLHTSPEATTPQTYSAFAAWCLADDYDGIQYVISTGENHNVFRISVALALPVENGYYLYTPYETSTLINDNLCFSAEVLSLENLENILEFPWTTSKPLQIFVADAEQRTLKFITNEDTMSACVSQGSAELVYTLSDETKAELEAAQKQQRIETGWNNLQNNWAQFGFPASFAPTLDKTQVESLIGKDIDTVSAGLKTLGDVMYYLALSGYYTTNGDLKVWENGLCWSFNQSPQTVFANNAGNCGGTAAFVPYLLAGDYEESGCLSMTSAIEIGGGHVITYVKDGGTYYVFDSRALVDTSYTWNGGLARGTSIVSAGQAWRNSVDPNYKLIFAYPTDEGDMPALGDGKTVYLPTNYRNRITIVYEDTAEGYKFEWRTITPEVLETINGTRNPVRSRPGKDVAIDTSGNYLTRVLTDEQLSELKYADLDSLQAWISTVADAVAFLDQFTPNGYSGSGNEFRLDIDFLYDLHIRPEATFSQTYTAFAAWCLADDYDGIQFVVCTGEVADSLRVSPALILPTQNGYLIYSPYERSTVLDSGNYKAIKTAEISSLENLEAAISIDWDTPVPFQIFLADAEQVNLQFILNEETMRASVISGSAKLVYTMSDETKAELEEAERQQRVQYAWNQLQNNWNSYGMPASMSPTMTKEEVEALVGKDIDTVAAACKTLGDCLYYYALSGFTGSGGDLQTRDNSIGGGNLWWHYNYAPAATFAHNTGNCGASSGLTSYLLQGDYATVGMIGMTFVEGAGGGHFINYLYDGSRYYVFDIVNLLAAFHQSGFCFSSGSTLKAAANNWVFISECPVRLMWAHQSFDGDVPVGWDWGNSHISYLPAQYKAGGEILMETPSEGYVYQWVTINPNVQAQIDRTRNP